MTRPSLRFAVALLSLVGVLMAAGSARAHGPAVSRFVVSIGESELAVRVHLHLESVVTLMEGSPDSVHAGEAQAVAARHQQRVLAYLHEHLTFGSGPSACVPREPQGYGVAEGAFYIRVDLEYDCPKPSAGLSVTSRLFEEQAAPHHIEGEFHVDGRQRVYQLTKVRSAVAIDPSSFDRPNVRGAYVPPLGRRIVPSETTIEAIPASAEAASEGRVLEPVASPAAAHADPARESIRSKLGVRALLERGGWYVAALALTVAIWHVQRTLRRGRSQRGGRSRRAAS